jgi:cytochrome c peroxidase
VTVELIVFVAQPFDGFPALSNRSALIQRYQAPLNIGVADLTNPLGVGYLPVITLQNLSSGEVVETTDPGRALITGKWADIGKFKGPILRGLAARAPYFHNGSAQTLSDAISFYDQRFGIGFAAQEKTDLLAFLSAL